MHHVQSVVALLSIFVVLPSQQSVLVIAKYSKKHETMKAFERMSEVLQILTDSHYPEADSSTLEHLSHTELGHWHYLWLSLTSQKDRDKTEWTFHLEN